MDRTRRPGRRPLYHDFAWAYDLLVTDPVEPYADVVVTAFTECGVQPGARVLDAGCGTGRYALELAARGFEVTGVDASPELVAVACEKVADEGVGGADSAGEVTAHPRAEPVFAVGDLCGFETAEPYDAVLCRGVLNDVLSDAERDQVLRRLAAVLRPEGLLVLDVRDWQATVARYRDEPVYERSARLDDGELRFRSSARLRPVDQLLLLAERITLRRGRRQETSDFDFAMRCWSEEELRTRLKPAGFADVVVRAGMRAESRDRLLCRAVRPTR